MMCGLYPMQRYLGNIEEVDFAVQVEVSWDSIATDINYFQNYSAGSEGTVGGTCQNIHLSGFVLSKSFNVQAKVAVINSDYELLY